MKPGQTLSKLLPVCLALWVVGGRPLSAEPADVGNRVKPAGFEPRTAPGIQNLFVLGTNVFSGSTPDGEIGFEALAKLGVKTIISVDGAVPDVAGAAKHGLRYVHLPHGYDGITRDRQLLLARAGRELAGPIYVHCHHGQHRGPTAAAVICLADQGWSKSRAEAFLTAAGTATNYPGLYKVVREFQVPTLAQINATPADFPEQARVSGLTDVMVHVDERWEHLKKIRAAGYRAPSDHPDLQPANEVVILWEHFREAQRLPEVIQMGTDLVERLRTAEAEAKEAERLLRRFGSDGNTELKKRLEKLFDELATSCANCHLRHRDGPAH